MFFFFKITQMTTDRLCVFAVCPPRRKERGALAQSPGAQEPEPLAQARSTEITVAEVVEPAC